MQPRVGAVLVGRDDALRTLAHTVEESWAGEFRFVAVVGDPGVGKSRLLGVLADLTRRRGLATLTGRASEFEQELPLSPLIDALDDHLESRATDLAERLPAAQMHLLTAAIPALADLLPGAAAPMAGDQSGLGRYRLYRAVRLLLEELAAPDGLALILDDVHWADVTTIELLDHLVRHPPRGSVLLAVGYRPAQAVPRLAAVAGEGVRVEIGPLTREQTEELLGPDVSLPVRRALYEASGGNPFYLDALARLSGGLATVEDGKAELPPGAGAALDVELSGLSPPARQAAHAAAVTADEFEPALVAVAAEMAEDEVLGALNEMVARDVVRPAGAARFRFRHPLVRSAAYAAAAPGWRYAAHARLADHLHGLGAPATARAHHVQRSGSFGDRRAVDTLVEAARTVAARAPVTAAHWLESALRLLPETAERLELLLELAHVQSVSGRLAEGRDTARELLRLLPAGDYARRARAARLCALMERQLDRPHEARALLLDELRQMPDPRAPEAVPLRMRLVAESLMRVDFRAAQAVLDLMPDGADDWAPGLATGVAAMRPMPAFAAGRVTEAIAYVEAAQHRLDAAPDEHLAEWLDAVAWLCWTQWSMGHHAGALRHFERAASIARSTGQAYILTNLLAGQARTLAMVGRLAEARTTAEESVEDARLLGSGQQLVFALTQQCLAASWSGEDDEALRAGEEAVSAGVGGGEVWGAMAGHARGLALINAGRPEEGAQAVLEACDRFRSPRLDRGTLLWCCETLAYALGAAGQADEAQVWAKRADALARPELPVFAGLARLARAHALRAGDPSTAARSAVEAAELLGDERRIDSGRALLTAGLAYGEAGERETARERLREAADVFTACGARNLHAQTLREQRRLGVRVGTTPRGSRQGTTLGLSPREMEIAELVSQGQTNQQIAEKLYLSVRTVETHLSRVFGKLGVSSRVGVVTALTRRDD
ncbi:LuxR family transcriptional regulator [Spongiactinospora sp. TRM90649]|uniref:helix-turn-helix transcriptional regulator n=1 Tax=Spongiactinospora sp. TRM90649 TaxID=3031114 RepID=UPI0023F67872|nr:LuxR family transcriptional regulator [Spongiactinospora sp. TRM90649]MDF5757112.1 AAA family ATPase [Spongiactinospora sp. TRM90649]